MLRPLLLMLSQADWARRLMMNWSLARRVARRFVAGETLEDAITAIGRLNAAGMTATVDVLGESIRDEAGAAAMRDAYLDLIAAVREHGFAAWVSVKLTALGLDLDEVLACQNLKQIVEAAQRAGLQVTIDMEDHTYTSRTLAILRTLPDDGCHAVRGVIQSYLYRSEADIAELAAEGIGIRLCKGAYREPEAVAYPRKADVDAAFIRQMKTLMDAAAQGRGYPGIATHDEAIIEAAKTYAEEQGIPRECFEFQMLHGIRTDLHRALTDEGYNMRVYVPFGDQWYPYFMRRLAERPANVWFFVSNFFRR